MASAGWSAGSLHGGSVGTAGLNANILGSNLDVYLVFSYYLPKELSFSVYRPAYVVSIGGLAEAKSDFGRLV